MNKYKNYCHYRFKLKKRKIFLIEKENNKSEIIKVKKFERPVTEKGLPKIYIIKDKRDIVYVGITSQSIRNRLRHGLQAKGEGGYHGYKFKELDAVDLFIFLFKKEKIERTEAIEAEIVYLIRNKTGDWPKYQTEIHFHKATKKEKRTARSIYETVK